MYTTNVRMKPKAVAAERIIFLVIADSHNIIEETNALHYKLLELRRDRDFHRRKALSSNSQYHWGMYRKLKNLASREERSLKSQYYCKIIENAKNDSSSMWKAIKQTLRSNHMDTNAIFSNGNLHTNFTDIVKHLNQHFSNIGRYLDKAFRNTSSALWKNTTSDYDFKLNPVSEMFVHKELRKMEVNKAIGLDKISARLLRDAAWVITLPLTHIINNSLKFGKFPSNLKCAKVTALFKKRTVTGQATSSIRRVPIGVPQGAIPGPLVFSIHGNDLPTCLKHTSVTLFADDTALYCSAKSSTELQQMLNEVLASVAEWLNDHKFALNVAKSKFMIIASSQRLKSFGKVSLEIGDEFLDKADCYKYLGVIINETLTWRDHVNYISTNVNQRLGILRRIKHLLSIQTRELYVKSMILSLLGYGGIVWGERYNKILMAKVQLL
ncbi:RNA-directed DNA polymerase from mobile element jockey [Stylophora pistillata]|uniref:RNA-directed DNA polymerase from mobile element jockey n=1 Tax=Stylophora pistillata TaxID=50429 RepID=A0A2B4S156_STYPI|nr:RNA-directed DNA polymerase from mobile element jockey [Stylophora pistillata]